MNDFEATKLCAEAMGLDAVIDSDRVMFWRSKNAAEIGVQYDPLHDDAQVMALIKKFKLWILGAEPSDAVYGRGAWYVSDGSHDGVYGKEEKDLNRAVVHAAAEIHLRRKTDEPT